MKHKIYNFADICKKEYCVYFIKNKINKKVYIGMTQNFHIRMQQHFYQSSNYSLEADMVKYGLANFLCGKIRCCKSEKLAKIWEGKYCNKIAIKHGLKFLYTEIWLGKNELSL